MDNQQAEKIKAIAAKKLNLDIEKIGLKTNFFTELGADSLKMLGFISELERVFDIEITDDQVQELYCLENVIKIVYP